MSLGADSENWRAISGYPAYQVSSDLGRVRSTEDWRILNLSTTKKGYRQITLYHNKKRKNHLAHRLVASEFIDNPRGKPCVDHIDRCKTNNFAVNLRWCTPSENNLNRSKKRNATSQYNGVCWDNKKQRWRAQITVNGRVKYLGSYSDERDAARAHDAKAFEVYGELANLNGIAPDDEANTDTNDEPELTTPISEYDAYSIEESEQEGAD